MTWQLAIVGLVGLAVGLAASYAWRGFTLVITWDLLAGAWVDLSNVRRQLATAEAELKAARMDAAFHKALADEMKARASAADETREPIAEPAPAAAGPYVIVVEAEDGDGHPKPLLYWPRETADGPTLDLAMARRWPNADVPTGLVREHDHFEGSLTDGWADKYSVTRLRVQRFADLVVPTPTPEPYIVPPDQTDADARKRPKGTLYVVRLTEPDGEVTYWPPAAGIYRINNLSRAKLYAADEAFELRAAAIAQAIWCVEAQGDVMDVVAIPPGYAEAAR